MAKKKKISVDPSDEVHGHYRSRNAGVVDIPVNSRALDDDRYIDQSRLGTHGEWTPGGGLVQVKNDVMKNIRAAMGGLKSGSSFKSGTEE
jgi:hypothetical protein